MAGEKLGDALLELRTDDKALDAGIARAQRKTDDLGKTFVRTERKGIEAGANIGKAFKKAGDSMVSAGKTLSTRLTLPIAGLGGAVLAAAGGFEKSMNKVRAISGATGEDFDKLRSQAKQMGETTMFSASQAAEAQSFLAMAGFETTEILGAMPGMLDLAAAGQLDLATTADIASNIMTGFNIEASEAGRVADILAKGATSANTNVQQLGEAMKFVAPVAAAAGVSLEDATAAIGFMSDAGIQASMAGTSLRMGLAQLIDPASKARTTLDDMGLSVTDVSGNLKPLPDIIETFTQAGLGANEMMQFFGTRAGPAMIALMQRGGEELRTFSGELTDSAGTAARIAGIQMEGFNGALITLKSALEGLAISIADSGLLEFATLAVNKVTEIVRAMTGLSPEVKRVGTIIAAVLGAGGPALIAIGLLSKTISAAFVVATGPVGLAIAAITAFTVAWTLWGDEITAVAKFFFLFFKTEWAKLTELLTLGSTVLKETVITVWTAFMTRLQEIIFAPFDAIRNKITGAWDAITSGARDMFNAVVGESFIPDMVLGVESWLDRLVKSTDEAGKAMTSVTKKNARAQETAAITSTGNMVDTVTGALTDLFGEHKAINLATAIMAVWTGISNALALPFPQNLAAAATTAAQGFAAINNLKSTEIGSTGSVSAASVGSAGSAGAGADDVAESQTQTVTQDVEVILQGETFDDDAVRDMIDRIDQQVRDGATISSISSA